MAFVHIGWRHEFYYIDVPHLIFIISIFIYFILSLTSNLFSCTTSFTNSERKGRKNGNTVDHVGMHIHTAVAKQVPVQPRRQNRVEVTTEQLSHGVVVS